MFGGAPFPATGRFELKEHDTQAGRAVITTQLTLDPERSKEILLQTLQRMAQQMGGQGEPPKEEDLPDPFSIEENAQYTFDTRSGWITSGEAIRTTVIGPARQDDTKTIREAGTSNP